MTATMDPPRSRRAKRWITPACVIIVLLFLVLTILTPSLCRAREPANRVKCAANLKQIGAALLTYANAHAGHYPDTLEQLVLSDPDIGKDVFQLFPSTP